LIAVQLAFASLAVEGKIAMTRLGVSPSALAMSRILGGAIVFGIAYAFSNGPRIKRLADVGRLLLLSLFGIVLNQALFLAGLRGTSPLAATLLIATIPVFAAAIAAIAGRERIRARTGAGIALAIVGIGALTGFSLPAGGDALVLLNSLSYALYVVFSKRSLERFGALGVVAAIFGFGAVAFAPFGGPALIREAPQWSPVTAGYVAFIVLVPTIFAYAGTAWALARATPTLVTIYVYLQPLVVVLLAWAQLGQMPEARSALAGLLILSGVTVVATAPRHERARLGPSSKARAAL
jgi:drug/metabolite transporter (DMT)-like permease